MDTGDLSTEAYEGILVEAEGLSHDLTLQYGLLSYHCQDEQEYLEKAERLTREIMPADASMLDDIFFGNPPSKERVTSTCQTILDNIEQVKSIPFEKRTFDF
jgi:hypothetical protein